MIHLVPHSLAEQSIPESKVIVTTLSFFSFLPLLPSTSSQSPPPRCRPHTIPNSFIRPSVGDADKKEPRYWAPTLFIDDVGITDREASREAFGSGINSSRRLFHPLASISLVVCGKLCTRCAPGVQTLKKKRREKMQWVTRWAVLPFPISSISVDPLVPSSLFIPSMQ